MKTCFIEKWRWAVCAIIALTAIGMAACAQKESAETLNVSLDFLPNALHIGLYEAEAMGLYKRQGVAPAFRTPSGTADSLKLVASGRAQLGISSLGDLMKARESGADLVALAAVAQQPLAAIIALPGSGIERPADLEGRLIGVTGVQSDAIAARAMIAHDGGDPSKAELINIGFNAVQQLMAGRLDAAVGLWSHEGAVLEKERSARVFKLGDYGAPPYPELILFARRDYVEANAEVVRAFLMAASEGYAQAQADPDGALRRMAEKVEGIDFDTERLFLEKLLPTFFPEDAQWGRIEPATIEAYLAWARANDLLSLEESPGKALESSLLP